MNKSNNHTAIYEFAFIILKKEDNTTDNENNIYEGMQQI